MGESTFEAVNWTCQRSMARDLLRRHRDVSTVRAMVTNHFGYSPDTAALTRIRDSMPKERLPGDGLTHYLGDNYSHPVAMEIGSRKLLEALWDRHQRVMLVAKARGRQVVKP